MDILVLSPSKKLIKDKTEYSSDVLNALKAEGSEPKLREFFAPLIEFELRNAVKCEPKPELVVVADFIKNSENDFRRKFAFIINRGERKVQNVPNTKEKIDLKKSAKDLKNNLAYIIGKMKKQDVKREEKDPLYVTYFRKKTRVFSIELGEKTAYAFSYIGTKIVVLPKKVDEESLENLPKLVSDTFDKNSEEYPEGYSLTERTLKVTSFSERHFPRKGDPKDEIIRKSVMLTALCAFLVAGYMFIYNMYVMPAQQQALQSNIRTIFYENETTSGNNKTTAKSKAPNWKKLKKINSDIKGWIKINNTKIDYPILQCKSDNPNSQFYLTHNYLKQYTPGGFGSIFIDYRSKKGMKSKNIILHGHHMEDGSMFGDLMKYGRYSGDLKFYKKNPTIKLSTQQSGTKVYKIISVFKSNVNPAQGEYFDFYCSNFKSKAQFMNYVYNLRVRSLINCPVSVNEKDQLVTLVTCSYEFPDFRTVIVARKCRSNESGSVDVNSAALNSRPVWPQCYYSRYGSSRPTISTFKTALKKGEIKWYDGNKKLSGSEQLPTSLKETTEPTTALTTAQKATKPPKKTYHIKISKYNKNAKKITKKKTVKEGTKVKLPKVSAFKKNGYKYTFKKWKVKGIKGKKYLSAKTKKITIRSNIKITATYKKTKIKVNKPVATKPTTPTKPATKPTTATEKPTETPNGNETEE
ncbi:MAG: class B sortase [Ruminococcus sp.]|nr:class B sortase [Ruminococcus sp.]